MTREVSASERWAQVKTVLADALEQPTSSARASFLDAACAGDAALRAEVESLLAAADGTGSLPGARAALAAVANDVRTVQAADAANDPAHHDVHDPALQRVLESAVGQQYEIVRPLGHGGMGVVYLARDRALERFVAIKVLRADLAEGHEGRERFRREARIAAQLTHPGILPLHTFGEIGGVWYFVMGYVRGQTLAERLRVEGRLPSDVALRILLELADALECAHRNGVVHRDLKPSNVLLDAESGHAVLADFGIAKVAGSDEALTATDAVIGTPSYMSPEQALGARDVDERSDLYSLGAVGYTMLAGHEPFTGLRGSALAYRRLSHDVPPLRTVAPWVSTELSDVLMRCLARERDDRWRSASALKIALARVDGADSGDASAALPAEARELPTFGSYALLWGAIWAVLAARPGHGAGDRALLLLVGAIVPAGLLLHVFNAASDDALSPRELTRIAFWPPEWWGMWWPRALRRPNDLWRRLPWPARAVRVVLSSFLVALPTLILLRQWVEARAISAPQGWFGDVELSLVLGAATLVAAAVVWARRRALGWRDALRLLFGATTASPGWNGEALAPLLHRARAKVREPDRDSPADHRRAIVELAAVLNDSAREGGARELGADVVRAADGVLAAIARSDAELAALGSSASVAEIDRLSAQLASLTRDEASGVEQRELAELVRQQLDVMQRMRVRIEMVAQQRSQLFGLLRGLETHLRGATAGAGVESRSDEPREQLGEQRRNQLRALLHEVDASCNALR